MPSLLLDLSPLRVSRPYRRMWLGQSLSGIGTSLTTVAVGLQVYDLTRSTLSVGLVGLFALVPLVVLGLYGGSVVDAHDRRLVIIISSAALLVVSSAFAVQAWLDLRNVGVLYALVAVQNGIFGISSPARGSVVARLLPGRLLPAANALTSVSFGISMTIGPLLAGVIVGRAGYGWAYSIEAVLLAIAFGTVVALPSLPPEGQVRRAGMRSVLEGLQFLGTRPNVRMTFLVDLCAMVLAMPRVLFPAIGAALLGGGATTVGILVAGLACGSILAGLVSGPLGRVHHQGRAVVVSVIAWGLFVACFGVVIALAPGPGSGGAANGALVPAVVTMVLAGAADTVSSVFRNTILQAATPDALQGRLQGVFIVVVAGGPRLGDLVLGAVADHAGEAFAAIAGGVVCAVVVTVLGLRNPSFRHYDAREPTP
ncbi:MAG TPA: MFS transporter [Actinotalea sp.]